MHKNGSLDWEKDDAPAESRFRRTQQVLSPAARKRRAPGMPLELPEDDDADLPRRRKRFDEPAQPWWRPTGKVGRILLAVGTLTIIGSGVTCWIMAKKYLEHDNRFRIAGTSNIQAAGLTQVTREDILPVFGADVGKNIFFVNLSDRRKALEQIPWIEHASVMRLLPDQVRVSVVERTPIAFVRHGQQIGLVDADGILLSMPASAMTQHHYSFPVVTGIDAGDPQPSRKARMAVYQRLVHDLDANGQHLSDQISEIDLTDPEDARVLMPEQGADILAHFGDEQFLGRYQRYKAHIAEWRQQYPHLNAVDLRYNQQVVLEMAPGTGGETQATVGPDGQPVIDSSKPAAKPAVGAKRPQPKLAQHKDVKKHPHTKHVQLNRKPNHAAQSTQNG